eukprot:SAG11_NODE_41339_length_195_cov_20.406250_1_plen_51_part_01
MIRGQHPPLYMSYTGNFALNKPIYAGMCILDLSKLHMYQFHYDVIKKKYGN